MIGDGTGERHRPRKRRARLAAALVGFAALAVAFGVPGTADAEVAPLGAGGQSGTTLSATKTATAHYTRTFGWTIDKSFAPATLNLFTGDTGTSEYTIEVTKDAGTLAAWVDGKICVTNGGAVATQNLHIVDELSMPPSQTVIASTNVDLSFQSGTRSRRDLL